MWVERDLATADLTEFVTEAEWNKTRAKVKREFQRRGVTYCQMCGSRSGGPLGLSFAYRVKGRFIRDLDELKIVALLCTYPCHTKLEHGPKEVMYETVTRLHQEVFGGSARQVDGVS